MFRRTKIAPLLIAMCVIAIGIGLLFFLRQEDTEPVKSVKVISLGASICTMDVPSSNCGPYEVEVKLPDGQKTTYKVPGFSNGDDEEYDQISSVLKDAEEHNISVDLQVNEQGMITSAQ